LHILFSLPVHEKNGIVRLTLANVRQHVPDSTVMLHVSEGFADFDWSISDLPNVLINPNRFSTIHGYSQFGIHVTNHAHAISRGLLYDRFCVLHTSEMFLRTGLENRVSAHSHALWYTRETMPSDPDWWPMRHAIRTRILEDTVPDRSWYLGSLLEGMWIHREIMDLIWKWSIARPQLLNSQIPWTMEEILLPTLTNWFAGGQPGGLPYNAFFDKASISIEDVDRVLAGESVALWATNCWNTSGNPVFSDGNKILSIKRLLRDLSDPVRQHIIRLTGLDTHAIIP
jgi:hypothetical protein